MQSFTFAQRSHSALTFLKTNYATRAGPGARWHLRALYSINVELMFTIICFVTVETLAEDLSVAGEDLSVSARCLAALQILREGLRPGRGGSWRRHLAQRAIRSAGAYTACSMLSTSSPWGSELEKTSQCLPGTLQPCR